MRLAREIVDLASKLLRHTLRAVRRSGVNHMDDVEYPGYAREQAAQVLFFILDDQAEAERWHAWLLPNPSSFSTVFIRVYDPVYWTIRTTERSATFSPAAVPT